MTERHPNTNPLWSDCAGPERQDLIRHLQDCAACRARVALEDSSHLFALLTLEPPPEGLLDRLSSAIESDLDLEVTATAPRRSWRWPAASLAASLALASLLATYVSRDGRPPTAVASGGPSMVREASVTEPGFELLSSPGEAQVVDLAVGEVRLVMIFDEELDL